MIQPQYIPPRRLKRGEGGKLSAATGAKEKKENFCGKGKKKEGDEGEEEEASKIYRPPERRKRGRTKTNLIAFLPLLPPLFLLLPYTHTGRESDFQRIFPPDTHARRGIERRTNEKDASLFLSLLFPPQREMMFFVVRKGKGKRKGRRTQVQTRNGFCCRRPWERKEEGEKKRLFAPTVGFGVFLFALSTVRNNGWDGGRERRRKGIRPVCRSATLLLWPKRTRKPVPRIVSPPPFFSIPQTRCNGSKKTVFSSSSPSSFSCQSVAPNSLTTA